MTAILYAAALVVYNNVANRFPAFHGRAYVPMNLALTCVVAALAVLGPPGLTPGDIGLDSTFLPGALIGLGIGVMPAAFAALLLLRPRAAALLADPRMRTERRPHLLYLVTIRIPLGTALTEEIAFRGVLPALMQPYGAVAGALVSSIAFGLWHVRPGVNRLLAANPSPGRAERTRVALNAVALTFLTGLAAVALRHAFGSLGVPFGIHAALNSGGALLAAAAHRRIGSQG